MQIILNCSGPHRFAPSNIHFVTGECIWIKCVVDSIKNPGCETGKIFSTLSWLRRKSEIRKASMWQISCPLCIQITLMQFIRIIYHHSLMGHHRFNLGHRRVSSRIQSVTMLVWQFLRLTLSSDFGWKINPFHGLFSDQFGRCLSLFTVSLGQI